MSLYKNFLSLSLITFVAAAHYAMAADTYQPSIADQHDAASGQRLLPEAYYSHAASVLAIKSLANDQQPITLYGYLTDYLGYGYYEFADLFGATISVFQPGSSGRWADFKSDELIEISGTVHRTGPLAANIGVNDAERVIATASNRSAVSSEEAEL